MRRATTTIAIAVLALTAGAWALVGHRAEPAAAAGERPNVVVIMTDDQTLVDLRQRFRGRAVMPNTLRLIAARGAEFRKAYASYPLSCPSRMTMLTGRYAHNHGVTTNLKPGFNYCAGFSDRDNTLPVWLQAAGYHTGHMGRYLNGYGVTGKDYVPPGYDEWHAPVGSTAPDGSPAVFYGYYMNDDGVVSPDPQSEYFTDRLNSLAVDFVTSSPEPFFVHLAHRAPHEDAVDPVGPEPEAAYRGSLKGVRLPKPPSFDEPNISDKPRFLRPANRLIRSQRKVLNRRNTRRLESLRSVDDGVGEIIAALQASGRLERTYVIFQSDNGFFRGEHRITKGKTLAYEPSARIPLLIRGPGIPAGSKPRALVGNLDVAPTIAALAGIAPTRAFDGASLLRFARHPRRRTKRPLLLESYALTINDNGKLARSSFIPKRLQRYQAIRIGRWKYVRLLRTREEELYNLRRDPHELHSLHRARRYRPVLRFFRKRLRKLRRCKGAPCRRGLGKVPKPLPKRRAAGSKGR